MAISSTKNKLLNEHLLFENSEFFNDPEYEVPFRIALQMLALRKPYGFNSEHLVERMVGDIGKQKFVDNPGHDYADLSDFKSAILRQESKNSWRIDVNVGIHGNLKKLKDGMIRLAIINPKMNRIDKFLLPKEIWKDLIDNSNRLNISWNGKKDYYNRIENYKVKNIKQFCKKVT